MSTGAGAGAPPELARLLDCEAHPEGGWYRRTWETGPRTTPDGYPGPRPTATGIVYVLGAAEESVWHRVRSDELWLWHRGAALRLWIGDDGDGPGDAPREVVLGPRVEDGQVPQALVPAGHWQSARPVPGDGSPDGGAVLVSCVVSPGFDFADFECAPRT